MDLRLIRNQERTDGVFSSLIDTSGMTRAMTAEHSYGGKAKLGPGTYDCVRGVHHLPWRGRDLGDILTAMGAKIVVIDGQPLVEFETFEITNVDGHSKILFHWGNFPQIDSEGCVLTGQSMQGNMVTNSRAAFQAFMQMQVGVNKFSLMVS